MNKSGTYDAGTAGLVTGQLESQMNKDLAQLFGQAKQTQRDDYMQSLATLEQLYPERFQVRNINNVNDYNNAINSYNVATQRNAATEADRLQRLASTNGFMGGLIGTGIGALTGNPALMVAGGKIGSDMANIGMSTYDGQTGGGMNGIDLSGLTNLFGSGQNRQTVNPNAITPTAYNTNSYVSGNYSPSLNYASTGAGMFNPLGSTGSSVPTQGNPAMANPVNKRSGMDFASLLQSMLMGKATDTSWA
jgi:hypothetical protein